MMKYLAHILLVGLICTGELSSSLNWFSCDSDWTIFLGCVDRLAAQDQEYDQVEPEPETPTEG